VTKDLSDRAAGAPHRAAEIFASLTLLLRNLVLSSDTSAGLHEGPDCPDGKGQRSNEAGNRDVAGRVGPVRGTSNLQSDGVHRISSHDGHHNLERVAGRNLVPWNSEPREVHPLHGLAHGNLSAPQRTAEMWMKDAITEAGKDTILPLARGGLEARSIGQIRRKGCEECVPLLHASSGLFCCKKIVDDEHEGMRRNSYSQRIMRCCQGLPCAVAKATDTHHFNRECTLRIVANLSLKGVSFWQ